MKQKRSLFDIVDDISFIRAIRRGLVMTIPLLMIGSFALVFNILPIPAYQSFLTGAGSWLSRFFVMVNQVTFGVLSLCITISVSAAHARIRMSQTAHVIGAIFSAVCAYAIFIGLFTDDFNVSSLGAQGMFTALVCALGGSALYGLLVRKGWFEFKNVYTVGANVDFNNIVSVIFPVLIVVVAAYIVNQAISLAFNVNGFEALFHHGLNQFFALFENLSLKAFLYVFIANFLWFFGIHGTNVLHSVEEIVFRPETGAAAEAALSGFLNKPVIDVFVLMGGCGATISLLVAILLFSKKKNNRSLGKMALFPMWFNINEMMVFGLPIVFNTAFFVPFLMVPVVNIGITGLALWTGLIPQPQAVHWTMPIFVNGYMATGSIMGIVVQAVNIMVGALIYRFFLLRYEKRTNDRIMLNMRTLLDSMKKAEAAGESLVLLEMKGGEGGLTKMLAADLKHVIDRPGSLRLFYQPQYNEKDECVGAEALLRWNHPLCGLVYPPLVIGLAEETGILGRMERKIFRMACDDITLLQEHGLCPGVVSVNATAATLQDPDFADFLEQLLNEYPNVRGYLGVELTEQMSFILSETVESRLAAIRDMGVRLEVDDFSMGHTSVKYLQSNLFDLVKLDGSLVKDVVENERSQEIVQSITTMGENMGFKVLAEFVETAEQRDKLAELGCSFYQGYLFSPAVPLEMLQARLQNEVVLCPQPMRQRTVADQTEETDR